MVLISIMQGHPKLSIHVIELYACPSMSINDHQGDHVVEVFEFVQSYPLTSSSIKIHFYPWKHPQELVVQEIYFLDPCIHLQLDPSISSTLSMP